MAKRQCVYKVEYYEEDKHFGWTNRVHDNVIANSETEALAKFYIKHDKNTVATVVNWIEIDY